MMRTSGEDLALVERCKRELPHQHKAFEQLITAYKDMIYTLCYRMTGNATDAEDLLQEILTKLFLNIGKFDGRSAFSSWLYRVAYNHCLNFLSQRRTEYTTTETLPDGDVIEDATTHVTWQDERTQAVLESIDPSSSSLLVMKYVMDLDIKEISDILQVGLSATKMRLARARDEFKRMFQETR
jgi:RNA polymerase sigma-70 factor (ECF subfamily)